MYGSVYTSEWIRNKQQSLVHSVTCTILRRRDSAFCDSVNLFNCVSFGIVDATKVKYNTNTTSTHMLKIILVREIPFWVWWDNKSDSYIPRLDFVSILHASVSGEAFLPCLCMCELLFILCRATISTQIWSNDFSLQFVFVYNKQRDMWIMNECM